MDGLALKKETSVDLYNKNLSFSDIKDLSEILKKNNTITHLDLGLNYIGDQAVKELACALEINRSLTSLNLEYNRIGGKGIEALTQALKHNQTLKKLNLRHNQIDHTHARILTTALEQNPSLTYLDLSFNPIKNEGAKALAEILEKKSFLKYLNLESTSLSDDGLTALATELSTNTTLTHLNFSYNMMDDKSTRALICSLNSNINKTLKSIGITLTSTPFNDHISQELITTLLDNNIKLNALNLSGSAINSENIKKLSESLETNQNLTRLDLSYSTVAQNEGENTDIQPLVLALEKNHTLTELNLDSNSRWPSNLSLQNQARLKYCIDRNIKENETLVAEIERYFVPQLSSIITDYAAIVKIEKKSTSPQISSQIKPALPAAHPPPKTTSSFLSRLIRWFTHLWNRLCHFMFQKAPIIRDTSPNLHQESPPSQTVLSQISRPKTGRSSVSPSQNISIKINNYKP